MNGIQRVDTVAVAEGDAIAFNPTCRFSPLTIKTVILIAAAAVNIAIPLEDNKLVLE